MNLLVTGGAGYVGSHCVRELCGGGHRVVVLDNLSRGHRRAVDPRAELVEGDLADSESLERLFAAHSFDGVLHFAAWLDVNESLREPLAYCRNNVANTINLLDAMRKHCVARLVFSSSCAVYGVPRSLPISEDHPTQPISPYGRTKLVVEWMMEDCARAWGLGGTALRYFNAAGAASDATLGEDHDPECHLIPLVLQVALGRRDGVRIFGIDYPTRDGTCIRDYIHVEDLAVAHRLAIEAQPEGKFRAYNVGTGHGVSVREIIQTAGAVVGTPIEAVPDARRAGDPPELWADATRIARELGWKAERTDVAYIMETAWAWHRAHPHGYETS